MSIREEQRLSIPSVAFFLLGQSTLNDGLHLIGVPDVADALGEVIWKQFVFLQ